MKKMFSLPPVFFALLLPSSLFAQSSDLAGLQSKLTVECKSIRGHAHRIVAEAAAQEFNRDVAAAHLGQVARYQSAMESDLRSTSELLTKEQQVLANAEMTILLETCKRVGQGVRNLQKEFDKDRPSVEAVRSAAVKIKNDMTQGAEVHDRLKKKLGIL
jgi:hypothetical protein